MIEFKHIDGRPFFYAIAYRFGDSGDAIPEHSHMADEVHDVYVMAGAVSIETEDETYLLKAGNNYSFDSTKRHRITAIDRGTTTLHRLLNGRPDWYDNLKSSDLEGRI